MAAGDPASLSYIRTQFNSVVQTAATGVSPVWVGGDSSSSIFSYSGNSGRPNPRVRHDPLGANFTAGITNADLGLSPGDLIGLEVFSAMHRFAMRYTNVRMAERWIRRQGGSSANIAGSNRTNITAFKEAITFPMPNPGVASGSTITEGAITAFLNLLEASVTNIRNGSGSSYTEVVMSCHSSCHSSCHGSRGRR